MFNVLSKSGLTKVNDFPQVWEPTIGGKGPQYHVVFQRVDCEDDCPHELWFQLLDLSSGSAKLFTKPAPLLQPDPLPGTQWDFRQASLSGDGQVLVCQGRWFKSADNYGPWRLWIQWLGDPATTKYAPKTIPHEIPVSTSCGDCEMTDPSLSPGRDYVIFSGDAGLWPGGGGANVHAQIGVVRVPINEPQFGLSPETLLQLTNDYGRYYGAPAWQTAPGFGLVEDWVLCERGGVNGASPGPDNPTSIWRTRIKLLKK